MRDSSRRVVRGALAAYVLCIWNTACMVPVQSNPDRIAASGSTKSPSNASPVYHYAAGTFAVSRLTVNAETVEAHELWLGLHDELSTKAKTLAPEDYRVYLDRRAARLITDKIAEMLLYQQASLRFSPEMSAKVDTYVDAQIRKIITTEHDGIPRRYERQLESQGRTLEDAREKVRREIIIASYLDQEVKPKVVEPTRAELLAAFQANSDSFRRPARRRMSLIDVRLRGRLGDNAVTSTHDQFESARMQARSRIQTAKAELDSGVDFAEVARRHSDGLHADEGGSWGWITKGSVRERFEPAVEALHSLDAGSVSNIIETDDGFFLVRCDQIDPGHEPDFQNLQPRLKERVLIEAYNRLVVEQVARLRSKARIEPANLERFHVAVVDAGMQRSEPRPDQSPDR
ncbi:MAG: peptidylprolyl isomerase [Phycisphaerales bacterium]|nr:MAG: peptidylprolyl isomerase [Phycisphaerales bacterium]